MLLGGMKTTLGIVSVWCCFGVCGEVEVGETVERSMVNVVFAITLCVCLKELIVLRV